MQKQPQEVMLPRQYQEFARRLAIVARELVLPLLGDVLPQQSQQNPLLSLLPANHLLKQLANVREQIPLMVPSVVLYNKEENRWRTPAEIETMATDIRDAAAWAWEGYALAKVATSDQSIREVDGIRQDTIGQDGGGSSSSMDGGARLGDEAESNSTDFHPSDEGTEAS